MPQNRTESQRAAARANGAKSQGPTSRMGKRISSRNSIKHGFHADILLLPDESRDSFIALSVNFFDVFRPTNDLEDLYVQRMVEAEWRLIRIRDYETAALMVQISSEGAHPEIVIDDKIWIHKAARGAAAFQRLHANGSIIQTSQMRYLRQFKEAETQLFRLREHATRWRIPGYEPGDLSENNQGTPLPESEPGPAPLPRPAAAFTPEPSCALRPLAHALSNIANHSSPDDSATRNHPEPPNNPKSRPAALQSPSVSKPQSSPKTPAQRLVSPVNGAQSPQPKSARFADPSPHPTPVFPQNAVSSLQGPPKVRNLQRTAPAACLCRRHPAPPQLSANVRGIPNYESAKLLVRAGRSIVRHHRRKYLEAKGWKAARDVIETEKLRRPSCQQGRMPLTKAPLKFRRASNLTKAATKHQPHRRPLT